MLSLISSSKYFNSKEPIKGVARIAEEDYDGEDSLHNLIVQVEREQTRPREEYKECYDIHSVYKAEKCSTSKVSKLDYGIGRTIKLCDDTKFELIPSYNPKFPDRILVFGRSGSGKSYFIGKYLRFYQQLYPENKIYLISRKEEDEAFSDIGYQTINIQDPIFEEQPLTTNSFDKNCVIVFDDATTFSKEFVKRVNHLRDDLLQVARSKNITVISTSHVFNDNDNTKMSWAESTHVVFPLGSQDSYVSKALTNRLNVNSNITKALVTNLKGRFMTITTNSPICVISDHEIHMID